MSDTNTTTSVKGAKGGKAKTETNGKGTKAQTNGAPAKGGKASTKGAKVAPAKGKAEGKYIPPNWVRAPQEKGGPRRPSSDIMSGAQAHIMEYLLGQPSATAVYSQLWVNCGATNPMMGVVTRPEEGNKKYPDCLLAKGYVKIATPPEGQRGTFWQATAAGKKALEQHRKLLAAKEKEKAAASKSKE